MKTKLKTEIDKFNPCSDALEFRKEYKTFKEAWDNCNRGEWMLWIAEKVDVNIHVLTYAKALCAETVIHLMKDKRSINAVKIAKRFGKYKATKQELNDAYAGANTAAAAAAAAAAYATYAATYAAAASAYAGAAANTAAAATYATTNAAASAYAYKQKNQLKTAEICRKHLTKSVFKKLKL